jgi:hypothetical protein
MLQNKIIEQTYFPNALTAPQALLDLVERERNLLAFISPRCDFGVFSALHPLAYPAARSN